ncbi:ATP synthase F1 subunit delta [Stenomitos frigidus]|uniref:ATP synthase subunit delta n=1 Tax=Stenomitos frigidus ULC18 TaxID=2107698 RepID=A0A2T1DVV8_9CYAN|nr:ATP synthase F1 subunit delta [Stenomitos frigidus]PSB24609.1 F0F1 ATP synthase subunit delta [Stenomitos frigidus ULC18]
MNDSVITSEISAPYAQALMSLAKSEDLSDRFGEDAASILNLLKESPDLDQFLASPVIDLDAKKAVLQQVLGDQVHPHVRNFLLLIVDHRRVAFLSGILRQYQALLRELNQTALAEVISAVELNEGQQQTVRDRVVALTGARQVDLETTIDPDLIGGVIIKVGSQIIDASLRGQLRRISLKLGSAT